MLYRSRPGGRVGHASHIVTDLIEAIIEHQDKRTLSVAFPSVLDHMKQSVAEFEMIVSDSIPTLNLQHKASIYK